SIFFARFVLLCGWCGRLYLFRSVSICVNLWLTLLRKLFKWILPALASVVILSPANAQKPLRWRADPSGGAPYVFNDPNHPDEYVGYEKERVDALAAAMGRKAEFVPSDWETLVSALQRSSFDVIVNGLEPTADRQRQIQFSKPY